MKCVRAEIDRDTQELWRDTPSRMRRMAWPTSTSRYSFSYIAKCQYAQVPGNDRKTKCLFPRRSIHGHNYHGDQGDQPQRLPISDGFFFPFCHSPAHTGVQQWGWMINNLDLIIQQCVSPRISGHIGIRIAAKCSDYGPITIAILARFEYDSSSIRLQHATTRYEVFRALAYEIVYENQW